MSSSLVFLERSSCEVSSRTRSQHTFRYELSKSFRPYRTHVSTSEITVFIQFFFHSVVATSVVHCDVSSHFFIIILFVIYSFFDMYFAIRNLDYIQCYLQ